MDITVGAICALCKHAIEPRTEAERAESGIDDLWWHVVVPPGTLGFRTLASHDTAPISVVAVAHPA